MTLHINHIARTMASNALLPNKNFVLNAPTAGSARINLVVMQSGFDINRLNPEDCGSDPAHVD